MATPPRPTGRSLPLHFQIAADIRRRIREDEIKPGDRLPRYDELAARYGVSKQTVQNALHLLKAEGLIETTPSTRMIVRSFKPTVYERHSEDRYAHARATGQLLSPVLRHEITFTGRAPAPADIAAIFSLEQGTVMVCRRRLLYDPDTDRPVELGVSWLRVEEFGGSIIETSPERLPKALFLTAEEFGGRLYATGVDRVTAGLPTMEEIEQLLIRADVPVLRVTHTALDADGVPIEVSQSTWPANRVVWVQQYDVSREGRVQIPSEV